ncbi:MAG: type I phosphomannose isomerase catalytic subunit [Dehalococcoidia bacterium]
MVDEENEKALRWALEDIKNSFIKPSIDNLVEVVWGGDNIEKLKGLPASGRSIGESWECSTHPRHPSIFTLRDDLKIPLTEAVAQLSEELLGREIYQEFGGQLPVLVKFLDAREDLSVQVHPSDEIAAELGENDTGKTEAWLVLQSEPGAVLYLGFKENVDKDEFERDLTAPDVNIAEKYLNAVPATPGDVIINPTGTPHAIGKGVFLLEIQQSSGITYRVWDWNRTPKRELHIPQALRAFEFRKTTEADFKLTPRGIDEKRSRLIDDFYFSVERINLSGGEELAADTAGGFEIMTCVSGQLQLSAWQGKESLSQGESVLVPASLGKYKLYADRDSVVIKSFVLTPQQIDPVIFQTYDVRAVADRYLSDRVCYYLGKGYGTFLRRLNNADSGSLWATVGGGVRLSTERIRRQMVRGILSSGVNVYDVGVTSTPELYFSIPYLKSDGGINITASHNEAEYNGLKQVIVTEGDFITSINSQQMLDIKNTVLNGDFIRGEGEYVRIEDGEVTRYHNEMVKGNCRLGRDIWVYLLHSWKGKGAGLKSLLDTISALKFPESLDSSSWASIAEVLQLPPEFEQPDTAVAHPFYGITVVIDIGSGSGWRTKSVYSDLGAKVVSINDEPDGSFPAHIPDPIKARYREQLEAAVLEEAKYSSAEVVGIGNDEDADRVIYVRSDGRVVEGDRSLAFQAKYMIDEHLRKGLPGKPRFMGEVKFSRIAEEHITGAGGEYIMSPTGFAFIKEGTKNLLKALRAGATEVELFGKTIDLRENREPVSLAAELSGHQMSGHEENWIFDDALLAAIKVLTVIASGLKSGKTLIDLDEEVPRYSSTPELNIRLKTNILAEKQEVVDAVVEHFRKKGFIFDTTDGGLITWFDRKGEWVGQALIRKSNTQPSIICRVEGRDGDSKRKIEGEFFSTLSKVSTKSVPKLDLASDDYIRESYPKLTKTV